VSVSAPKDWLAHVAGPAAAGLRSLPGRFRSRAAAYLTAARNPGGGWPGPRGGSDVYYTAFALRAMDLLRLPDAALWHAAARYLAGPGASPADLVDWQSFLQALEIVQRHGGPAGEGVSIPRVTTAALGALASRRLAGGGFAKMPGGGASLYHTFLAALCYGLLEEPMPGWDAVADVVLSHRGRDGGFADLRTASGRPPAGVNPTAAGVQLLAMADALAPDVADGAARFVLACRRPDGGFGAWPGAPFSDLLSTFTALVTLITTGRGLPEAPAATVRFIRGLYADGGFCGAPPDRRPDAEYTYYGIASLGLMGSLLEGGTGDVPLEE